MSDAQTAERVTPFDRLGGRDVFRAITDRFYDLMDSEEAFAELRALHAQDLSPMRESLPLFLAGWAGGPREWFERNPGQCMFSVHEPFAINHEVAGQWADAMRRAIAETETGDDALATAMGDALAQMATGMGRG